MFHIALYSPKIAQNTGNIIRLVANNGCQLHLIDPLGFDMDDKKLKRAGLDYHDLSSVHRHKTYPDFLTSLIDSAPKVFAITTSGHTLYHKAYYNRGDILLFGSETHGLPDDIKMSLPEQQQIRIPMQPHIRCINLSNAVAIVSYEAWRQHQFFGGS
ncbi:tRNA (cytidine(34)-2'-O)-methyltransferase [invertebrate metagenome]|uniref:tRNA (Cytidine(34)-2'-O)-methyltransferase n=1 Tax=invertebrate metagenome TaxID=1711999 RepID=A0A2H9T8R7_9ZZZZ